MCLMTQRKILDMDAGAYKSTLMIAASTAVSPGRRRDTERRDSARSWKLGHQQMAR